MPCVRVGQVLEKGAPFVQQPILNVLHCLLHYMDLGQAASHPINADLLRAIARYAQVRGALRSSLGVEDGGCLIDGYMIPRPEADTGRVAVLLKTFDI